MQIQRLKEILEVKKEELQQAAKNSDKQVVDTRIYVERSDRQNQLMLDREIRNREELIGRTNEFTDLMVFKYKIKLSNLL